MFDLGPIGAGRAQDTTRQHACNLSSDHAVPPAHTLRHSTLPLACALYIWIALAGVSSFDVSLEKQSVVVKGSAPYETVLEKIKKTGKEVRKGEVIA